MNYLRFDAKMKRMVLIGDPIGGASLGLVFDKIFEKYGFNGIYYANELKQENFDGFMKSLPSLGICGIGVTMPYKQAIVPYLDDMEEIARVAGVANNIAVDENGRTYGYATDGYGMCQALENAGAVLKGSRALMLGAGGVGSIASAELARRGAKEIVIANRTLSRAEELAEKIEKWSGVPVKAIPFEREALDAAASNADLILQGTCLGMVGEFDYLGFLDKAPAHAYVIDAMIEDHPSDFLKAAEQAGLKWVDGLPMFVCQVERICEKCFGLSIDEETKKQAETWMLKTVKGEI